MQIGIARKTGGCAEHLVKSNRISDRGPGTLGTHGTGASDKLAVKAILGGVVAEWGDGPLDASGTPKCGQYVGSRDGAVQGNTAP
jgi:hypothetical protein